MFNFRYYLLLIAIQLVPCFVDAQIVDCDYRKFLQEGIQAYEEHEFLKAENLFEAAKLCSNAKNNAIVQDSIANWQAIARKGNLDFLQSLNRRNRKQAIISESNRLALLSNNFRLLGDLDPSLYLAFRAICIAKLEPSNDYSLVQLAFGEAVEKRLRRRESQIYRPLNKIVFAKNSECQLRLYGDTLVQIIGVDTTNIFPHDGYVFSIRFAPNDSSFITTGDDHSAKLWNLKGELLSELEGHRETVNMAAYSPDGRFVLTCSRDSTAIIWDQYGKRIVPLIGHQGNVYDGEFSPSSDKIITRSTDGTVKCWSINGALLRNLDEHTNYVHTAHFSSNGELVLTASSDSTAIIWSLVEKSNWRKEIKGHSGVVKAAYFVAGENGKILTWSTDGTIGIWTIEGVNIFRSSLVFGKVLNLSLDRDNNRVLTIHEDKSVRLWDLEGRLLQSFEDQNGEPIGAKFTQQGNFIITIYTTGYAKLWNITGRHLMTMPLRKENILAPSITKDGDYIIYENELGVFHCPTPEKAYEILQEDTGLFSSSLIKELIKAYQIPDLCLENKLGQE